MSPGDYRLAATVSWIAAVIAAIVAIALPLTYFLSARNVLYAVLETEAEINARIAAQVVRANPTLWRFQTPELEEFVKRRSRHGGAEIRRVVDLDGKTIAESADAIAPPVQWRSADIMDAGVNVGQILIGRSMTPLLWRTAEIGVFALLLGMASFFVLRVLPLRALRRALDEKGKLIEDLKQREGELARANQGFQQREADLSRSNEDLQQFAYVASHDLHEPLRVITSYTQLLAKRYKGKLDKDADEYIGFAVDGAKRMQGLIQDLLAYSRVGTKGKELAPTDCEAVLSTTLRSLALAISESGAQITHDPLPTVRGDPGQLGQLFQNLIDNAIKYRNGKGPEVHVSCTRQASEWLFGVKDNGIGIDPQYADRVFIIFQRLHTRDEYEGTGIGLAVCKKIVERHGGKIWVDSEPGHGSTFYFTLPRHSGSAEADRAPSASLAN